MKEEQRLLIQYKKNMDAAGIAEPVTPMWKTST